MTAGSDSSPRFLILGASGFIGRHLSRLVGEQGFRTLGTHSGRRSYPLPVFRLGKDRILDCIDRTFLQGDAPCWVVHATNFGSIDHCFRHPEESRRVNVEGVMQAIEDLDGNNVRHIFLSTSCVFDGEQGDYSEDAPCRPLNLYGQQNREVELWLHANKPDSLIFRLDKIVGTSPLEDHLFAQWQRLVIEQSPIVCMQGLIFSPTLVDDIAAGIVRACRHNLRGLYHIAPDESHPREGLVRKFLTLTAAHTEIVIRPPEELGVVELRPLRTNLCGSRFQEATGHPCTSMQDAIRTYCQRLTSLQPVPEQ